MQFLARGGTDLGLLHEASFFHKTDLLHGAALGFGLGGVGGVLLGALIIAYPPEGTQPQMVAVLVAAVVGAAFGAWTASMAAAAVPNSRLKQFHEEIPRGQGPLILGVPFTPVPEIPDLGARLYPE